VLRRLKGDKSPRKWHLEPSTYRVSIEASKVKSVGEEAAKVRLISNVQLAMPSLQARLAFESSYLTLLGQARLPQRCFDFHTPGVQQGSGDGQVPGDMMVVDAK
jgi:hypothetical protein